MMVIAWRIVKSSFKDKKSWIIMFAMPLLFTLIFGGMAGGEGDHRPKVGLITEGKPTPQAEVLISRMKSDDGVNFIQGKEKALQQKLKDAKLVANVKLDPHWTDVNDMPVTLISQQDSASLIMIKRNLLNHVQEVRPLFQMIEEQGAEQVVDFLSTPMAAVTVQNTSGEGTEAVQASSMRAVGFIVMFVMMVVMTAAGAILQEKEEGTWARLRTSPHSTFEITGGFLGGFFLIGLLQFYILIEASSLIFGVEWGNLAVVFVLVVVFLLVAVSLGLLLSAVVKTTRQQQSIGSLLVTATCMLGGVFWPLDLVPDAMQTAARFVPQYWVMDGMNQVMFNNGQWLNVLPQVGVLALFAAVFFSGSLVLQGVQRRLS